jgi:hypothetical protein
VKKATGPPPGLWHYTVVPRLEDIMISGEIRPATALLDPGVKPAVWCSTNPAWEETANKLAGAPGGRVISLDRAGTHKHFGLARIAVREEAAPHTWTDYQRLSGDSRKSCRGLERSARNHDAWPAQWRCSFEPIPARDWLEIEVWDGAKWRTWREALKEAST